MTKKLLALLLILLLMPLGGMAGEEAVQDDWPAFIAEHFPPENGDFALFGPLAAIETMPGLPLAGETHDQGMTIRSHWAAFDGAQLLVLFSAESDDPAAPATALNIRASLGNSSSDSRGILSWYDKAENRLYCLIGSLLLEEEDIETLDLVVSRADMDDRARQLALVNSTGIVSAPPIGSAIDTSNSAAASLTIHEFTAKDGRLTVRCTLTQRPDDELNAYLVLSTFDYNYTAPRLASAVEYVDGDATLTFDIADDAAYFLVLASDTDESLSTSLFSGWTLPVPTAGYADPPVSVRRIPLDESRTFTPPKAPEVDEALSPLAAMLQKDAGKEQLASLRITFEEAILYQCGATILYTARPINPEDLADVTDVGPLAMSLLSSLQPEWIADEAAMSPYWFCPARISILHDADGVLVATGRIELTRAFFSETPLTLTISHEQFDGDPVTFNLWPQ